MNRQIRAAGLLWAGALFTSRVIGLIRDSVLGHTLGVSPAADVYQTAFRLPDWFVLLLAGGSLSVIFIPIFTAHLERGDEARGWNAFSQVANFLLLVMGVVGAVLWALAPALAPVFAPGFSPEQLELLTRLFRIILPAQAFHVLGGLLSASLLARDQHAVPALSPLVYSGAVIAGGLWTGTAEGFAWGVFVGAFAGPFLLPLVAALRAGLRWRPVLSWRDPDLRAYLAQWLPVLLGGSLMLFDDTLIARFGSSLDTGSIAMLGYAKTLMRAPMGIFGAAMGYAAYSGLTRLALEGRREELYALVTDTTRRVLMLTFASQVGLTVAAAELGVLVYGTARIPVARMETLGWCLGAFSLGLGAWGAQILLARAFYAQGRGWVPARLGLLVAVAGIPVYAAAGRWLGAPGLALASSLVVTASVLGLQWTLKRACGGRRGYGDLLVRALPAVGVAVAVGLGLRGLLPPLDGTRMDAAWRAVVLGGGSTLVFVGLTALLRVPELDALLGAVRRRLRRGG